MTNQVIVTLIGIVVSAEILIISGIIKYLINNERRTSTLETTIKNLCENFVKKEDFAKACVKVDLFWTTMERLVPDILIHNTPPRRIELINKYKTNTLSIVEMIELKDMLEKEMKVVKNDEKSVMVLMVYLLEQRLAEVKGEQGIQGIQGIQGERGRDSDEFIAQQKKSILDVFKKPKSDKKESGAK
jgi:hypothetical protein